MALPRRNAKLERKVRSFFRHYLTHVEGEWAGRPLELEPWQWDPVLDVLTRVRNGRRVVRTCFLSVARKNGKSTLAAGVALYLLFCDNEPGAQIFSCAADRDQATIVFSMAQRMVEANPELSARSRHYRTSKTIVVPESGSFYRAISSDAYTKHGLNAHAIIFDELHAQPNRELWDVMTSSVGSRRQPLTFAITTAGWDRQSICYQEHQYAQRIREGVIEDDTYYPVIYQAEPDDDWTLEETWKKANPNYGVSVQKDFFVEKVAKAIESPDNENTFRQLHLNQWTEQAKRWLPMRRWRKAGKYELPDLAGAICYGGLDLASTTDLTAFALNFPLEDDRHAWLVWAWVPEDNVERREKRDRVPYRTWEKAGYIAFTPGDVTDYSFIRAQINELSQQYDLREIGYDRYNGRHLALQLTDEDGLETVEFPQNYANYNEPMKKFEQLVKTGRLHHGGNPLLTWCASNLAVRRNAQDNIMPDKLRSSERIDAATAGVMALGVWIQLGGGSVYDAGSRDDGLLVIG